MTKTEDAFLERRLDMVQAQIAARGVEDKRVLAAMAKVPRHRFVAEEDKYQAYADHPIPIGWGQTISQPYMVAAMTELLGLQPDSRVLEVGTGSGYQTAILAELASSVFTIEVIPRLMVRAMEILSELGYDNIRFRCGDGRQGWPEEAPFDGVIVTCAPDRVPDELVAQLADWATWRGTDVVLGDQARPPHLAKASYEREVRSSDAILQPIRREGLAIPGRFVIEAHQTGFGVENALRGHVPV